jgi:hypothetical protein
MTIVPVRGLFEAHLAVGDLDRSVEPAANRRGQNWDLCHRRSGGG